jgi:hypothetical protein
VSVGANCAESRFHASRAIAGDVRQRKASTKPVIVLGRSATLGDGRRVLFLYATRQAQVTFCAAIRREHSSLQAVPDGAISIGSPERPVQRLGALRGVCRGAHGERSYVMALSEWSVRSARPRGHSAHPVPNAM